MAAKTDQELLDLYGELGSAKAVREYLLKHSQDPQPSVRTIQRRLHSYAPEYQSNKAAKGRAKKDKEDTRPVAAGIASAPDTRRGELTGKRFVFTTAQNNTYVHENFFWALQNFCADKGAELIVSTITYNKSGFQNGTKDDDKLWYDPRIEPYIRNESLKVANGLIYCGELDILPTAVYPLSGFENYTQEASGVVPHTKVQMQSLPRMKDADPRFMYTTGAITLRNYIQRKAGQKAEFHHVFGALYVEIDEQGDWFARQLVANEDGVFHDLDRRYSKDDIQTMHVSAITWGDIHVEKADMEVFRAAWGMEDADGDEPSMMQVLNPTWQFIHDLTDFRARNHHNIRDPFFLAEMHHRAQGNVERDLHRCGAFLAHITRFGNRAVVVDSNHDQALQRWLREADIRQDPENAEFFHRASMMLHMHIRANREFNVFEWAVTADGTIPSKTIFLKEDDSFLIHGIEQGLHGHRGPNGARGNHKSFRMIGRKVNIGHTHSAGIIDGVYVAGVSGSLDMGYNTGPSSWSHSHIVTYANGKRAIVTMKRGKWRA